MKDGDVLEVLFTEGAFFMCFLVLAGPSLLWPGLGFVTWTDCAAQLWRLSGLASGLRAAAGGGGTLSASAASAPALIEARSQRPVWPFPRMTT